VHWNLLATMVVELRAPPPSGVAPSRAMHSSGPGRGGSAIARLLHRGAQGGATELRLVAAWSFGSGGDIKAWLNRGGEVGKVVAMAASVERCDAIMVASFGEEKGRCGQATMKALSCFPIYVMGNGASVRTLSTSIDTHFTVHNAHEKMEFPLEIALDKS
jgi:hypothetical protein